MVNRSRKRCKKFAYKRMQNNLSSVNTNNLLKMSRRLRQKRSSKNVSNKVKQIFVEKMFQSI